MDGATTMIFHKTDDSQNPGVGDYDITKIQLELKKKSPKATIGNQPRFPKQCSINTFQANLPDQYVQHASKMNAKPVHLGTFNNEKRWDHRKVKTPGVGDYDLTGYKNWAKVSETNFVIPPKLTNIQGSGDKRNNRAKSAMHRQVGSDFNSRVSRSPTRRSGLYSNMSTRKLGGPQQPNTNFMMQATRFQRTLMFTHEGDSANLNKLGQGPAAYDTTSHDKDQIGKKFAFTIPKVSAAYYL